MNTARNLLALGAVALTSLTLAPWIQAQVPDFPPRRPVPPRPIPLPHPIPEGRVVVASVAVDATIRDGVAETSVTHVLSNRSGINQEADFLFPIPPGATVSSFAMYDGEKKMDARLLDRDEATAAYEEIVRRRKDPALLTFQGRSALRARVFPIEPGRDRRITLKLVTVLPREGDARKYAWTLVGPHLPGGARPEKVSVRVSIAASPSVGNVYSPTHTVDIRRESASRVVATWEGTGADTTLQENPEFDLYVSPGAGGSVALSALTYNAALPQVASLTGGARQSGYFLVVASPTVADNARVALPRRVLLVMDRSGSMQGKKIEQAKAALRFALGKLRSGDSFNILTFSDKVEKFAPEPVAASPDNKKRADAFVDDIIADGGTNINDALKEALSEYPEKSSGNTLLFFTDGQPTVGVRDHDAIVRNAVAGNNNKARTFVFGVGYDVDVPFLDTVARSLRGDADYVRPDEDIEVKTSQFVAKTSAPVLENLKIQIEGAKIGEVYPRPDEIPDLFAGSQLVLVGRYTGGNNNVHITLTGDANGRPQRYETGTTFPAVDTTSDFLPRLWASRKIGHLLDEVRLRPDAEVKREIIDQIVSLSREYGILTPYTALFVPEPGEGDMRSRPLATGGFGGGISGGRGGGASDDFQRIPAAPAAKSGEVAVNASQAARAQRSQTVLGNSVALQGKDGAERKKEEALARRIQNVASRTFYQRGDVWEDAGYDPKKQTQVVRVKLYSPAYFDLTRRNKDLARWAALGQQVRVVANATQAVEFGPDGKETLTEAELKSLAGK